MFLSLKGQQGIEDRHKLFQIILDFEFCCFLVPSYDSENFVIQMTR